MASLAITRIHHAPQDPRPQDFREVLSGSSYKKRKSFSAQHPVLDWVYPKTKFLIPFVCLFVCLFVCSCLFRLSAHK